MLGDFVKGTEVGHLLTIFLSVAIGFVLLVVIWHANQVLSEGAATTGSALRLGDAIKGVYQCVQEEESKTNGHPEDCEEKVNITMPQQLTKGITYYVHGGDYSYGNDPKWIIYHSREKGGEKGSIGIILYEITFTDVQHVVYDKCPNGICYGMVEMSNNDKVEFDKDLSGKVEPFWLLSPCGAEVKVYYDKTKDKIKICKIRNLGKKDGFTSDKNFCWNNDPVDLGGTIIKSTIRLFEGPFGITSEPVDTNWPEKSKDWSCSKHHSLGW